MENEKRLIDKKAKIIDKYLKARMISLDEALKATHNEIFWTESQQAAVRSFLVRLPKADAVEVVHGTWLDWHGNPVSPDAFYRWWRCSECKYQYVFDEAVKREHFPSNYCPNCGAKMDGDGNG